MFVRQKLDEGLKVIVTGSNAALVSMELGSKLTGRYITRELFPFSYREFLTFKKLNPSEESLEQYLSKGEFPAENTRKYITWIIKAKVNVILLPLIVALFRKSSRSARS